MNIKDILQGRFLSHPLHPALVHFPIGCWSISFLADLVAYFGGPERAPALAHVALTLIGVGLVFAVPTVVTGLAEFVDVPGDASRYAWMHLGVNFVLLVAHLGQVFLRPVDAVPLSALLVNGACFLLLAYSGYLGGKMVYEHGVGFRGPPLTPKGNQV